MHNSTMQASAVKAQASMRNRAWWTVVVLAVLGALATADRTIVSMLVHSIQRDLGIGDFDTGLLLGPAFAITYVLFSLPVGVLVDHFPRRSIILTGVLVWSAATLLSATAASFAALFVFRVLVGTGEASISPATHSLISDLFPRERRTAPLSVYQAGQTIGAGRAMAGSGILLVWYGRQDPASILGGLHDWQLVFVAIGLPGLALAFLALLLPEPRRGTLTRPQASAPLLRQFLRENRLVLTLIALIFGCSVTVTTAQGAWTAEYLRRAFHWKPSQIGATLGAISIVMPMVGHFTSGFAADWLARRGKSDAALRLYLLMATIAFPFVVVMYLTDRSALFVVCACVYALLVMPSVALGAASLQQITPSAHRGKLAAAFLAFVNLVGVALGPVITGALSEFGFRSKDSLGLSLAWVSSAVMILMITLLWFALAPMRAAVARCDRAESLAST